MDSSSGVPNQNGTHNLGCTFQRAARLGFNRRFVDEFVFFSFTRTNRQTRAFSAFCFQRVRSCPNKQASELRDSVRGRGRVLAGWEALTLARGMVCFQETRTAF